MFENKEVYKFIVLLLVGTAVSNAAIGPVTTEESASARMYSDYIQTLYKAIGETKVNNMYNMLKVFSHSTVEQAQQVVHYIEEHSNITRSESSRLRMAANASVEVIDCIYKKELDLLQAFTQTGYNLHNCIRSAQVNYEKAYAALNNNLDALKSKTVTTYTGFRNLLKNCAEPQCFTTTLLHSVVQYEGLREELERKVTDANNLTSRYIVTSIAMGCVSSSLQQIYTNNNMGKDLMARCFHENPVAQHNTQQHNMQQQPGRNYNGI